MIVSDTTRALGFYCDILGLRQCDRPELGFPGAWLQLGEQQIHLLELPNPDPVSGRPDHGGRDRHLALEVVDIESQIVRLEAHNHTFTRSRSGRNAVFCRDPDGNGIELVQSRC